MAAAKARYAQAASAFAPISAENLAPQMQLFVEKCEGLYGTYTMPHRHAYTYSAMPRALCAPPCPCAAAAAPRPYETCHLVTIPPGEMPFARQTWGTSLLGTLVGLVCVDLPN